MTKEKGECRKSRRDVVGELDTSFPSIKARLNFSAVERMQTKMETWPYNFSHCWERRQRAAIQGWGPSTQPRYLAHSNGFWGLLHWKRWLGAISLLLAFWLLCLSPGTVLGDTKDGYPQSTMRKNFFISIMHLKTTSIFSTLSNWSVICSENFRTIHKGKGVHLIEWNSNSKDLKNETPKR